MPLLRIRSCYFGLFFYSVIVVLTIVVPPLSFSLDPLPHSPRVGSLRIPLLSYNRVPISKLFSEPASYHLREIRIAGTVRTIQTRVMTQGCGVPYELTVILLEDGSGKVDIIDKGACGRNRSPLRAPTLAAGDLVDLLVQVVGGAKTDESGVSPEVFVLWINRTQE
jgi:hypothetical protein